MWPQIQWLALYWFTGTGSSAKVIMKLYGGPHAEVNCIADAEKQLRHLSPAEASEIIQQSTLYVSLEPCAHHGKTPPCSELIIQKKIGRVVIASQDPFAKVNGKGITKFGEAGIEVELGILCKESNQLNRRFICFHKNKRPFIMFKWAESADGFISKEGEKNFLSAMHIQTGLFINGGRGSSDNGWNKYGHR